MKTRHIIGAFLLVALLVGGIVHAQTTETQIYKKTVRITTSDTASLLTDLIEAALLDSVNWSRVKTIILSCEGNDVRVAFGRAPTQGASGVGHVIYAGTAPRWTNLNMIRSAQVISKEAGRQGVLQVTMEY